MRYGVELRRQEARREQWEVKCFKYGEKGHKCRKCPLWVKKEKLAYPVKGKAQEKERSLRRIEGKAAHVAMPQKA